MQAVAMMSAPSVEEPAKNGGPVDNASETSGLNEEPRSELSSEAPTPAVKVKIEPGTTVPGEASSEIDENNNASAEVEADVEAKDEGNDSNSSKEGSVAEDSSVRDEAARAIAALYGSAATGQSSLKTVATGTNQNSEEDETRKVEGEQQLQRPQPPQRERRGSLDILYKEATRGHSPQTTATTSPIQQQMNVPGSIPSMQQLPVAMPQNLSPPSVNASAQSGVDNTGGAAAFAPGSLSDAYLAALAAQQQQQQQGMNDLMMLAMAQQQAAAAAAAFGGAGVGLGGAGDLGVWTPEEVMAIQRAQDALQQQAYQFATQAYTLALQQGKTEVFATEEAKNVFNDYIAKGTQNLHHQVQNAYSQRMQVLLQQRAAMEVVRSQQQQQQQLQTHLPRSNPPSGSGQIGQTSGTRTPPTALNCLVQAVDERPRQVESGNNSAMSGTDSTDLRRWRDSLIGSVIEVEYGKEWFAAKVVSRNHNVFVVEYEEDGTQEKMKLFPSFMAQDPEGEDNFHWRMFDKKKNAASKASSGGKRKNQRRNEDEDAGDDDNESVPRKPEKNGKASDEASTHSGGLNSKLDPEAERERRAQRALERARRMEEDALSNAKKHEADAMKKKADEDFKGKKEEFEKERKQFEAERKQFENERSQFTKLREEVARLKDENDSLRKQLEKEKAHVKSLLKGSSAASTEPSNELDVSGINSDDGNNNSGTGSHRTSDANNNANTEDQQQAAKEKKLKRELARLFGDDAPRPAESKRARSSIGSTGSRTNGEKMSDKPSKGKGRRSDDEAESINSSEAEEEEEAEDGASDDGEPEVEGVRKRGRPPKNRKSTNSTASEVGRKSGKILPKFAPRNLGFLPEGKFGFECPVGPNALTWKVRVWWKDDKKFYTGTVDAIRAGKHKIVYDDGDVEWLVLSNERIEWFIPAGTEFAKVNIDPEQALAL